MNPHHTDAAKRLYKAMLLLETEEECAAFFEDLCTIREMQDLSQRLEVAVRLHNKENYISIGKATGVSTATISRVSRCLNYGSGGYREAIKKLEEKP